jgi:hypothetical protein
MAKLELRKPGQRSLPSEDAIAELEGRAEGIASKAPGTVSLAPVATAPPTPQKRSRLRREQGGERITAYLPPDLAEELRVCCAKERRSVSDAVTDALRAWLAHPN